MKNQKLKSKIQKQGYTIVELLAVASILVVLSGVMVGVIYSTLRGSGKTQVNTQLAQNGIYASNVIQGIISDSRNVTKIDQVEIDDCTAAPVGASSITLRRIDGGTTEISCQLTNGQYTIASNGASLLDTRNVHATNCSFSCTQLVDDPYSIPLVNVSFKLLGRFESANAPGFVASATSSLRVYSP